MNFGNIDYSMIYNDGFGRGLGFIPNQYNMKAGMVGGSNKKSMNDVYKEKYKIDYIPDPDIDYNYETKYFNKEYTPVYKIGNKPDTLDKYIEKEEEKVDNDDEQYIEDNYNDKIENVFHYNLKKKQTYYQNTSTHNWVKANINKKNKEGWGMIGGMAKHNPLLNDLTYEGYKNDINEDGELEFDYNMTLDDFINFIKSTNKLNNEEKKIIIEKHIDDIGENIKNNFYNIGNFEDTKSLYKEHLNKIKNFYEEQFKNNENNTTDIIDENIINKINEYLKENKNKTKQNYVLNYENYNINHDFYDNEHKKAKENDIERGNIVEDKLIKYQNLTDLYDDNDSDLISSKNDEFYNNQYRKYMINFFNGLKGDLSNLEVSNFEQLKDIFMIDGVKYGDDPILWEIKSFTNKNDYQKTKFDKSAWDIGDNKFIFTIIYDVDTIINNDVKNMGKTFNSLNEDDIINGIRGIQFVHKRKNKENKYDTINKIDNILNNKDLLRYSIIDISGKGSKVYNVIDNILDIKGDIANDDGKYTLNKHDFKFIPSSYSKDYLKNIKEIKKENKQLKKIDKKIIREKFNKNILRKK
jgi:hypothetical protein